MKTTVNNRYVKLIFIRFVGVITKNSTDLQGESE